MPIVFEPPAAMLAAQSAGTMGSLGDGSGVAANGGSQVWIAASPTGGSPSWGGCQVWLSFDDVTFTQIGTITSRANQGVLTAALPAYGGANPDTTDTLAVDLAMSAGALPTATDAGAQAARTLAYVDGEYIAFGATTPTTGYAYHLTDLYRALYGGTGGSHASGAAFVLLDDNIFKYNLPSSYAGSPLYFKFPSFNSVGAALQDLSALTAVTYTPTAGVVPSGTITGGDASVSATGIIALDTVNADVGTFQGITVNAKGLVTGAVNESYLTGNQTITLSGDVSGSGTTAIAATLATTGVTAGSYTYGSFTVDANGRLTAASSGAAPPSAANPTGTIGLATVNGSATSFMRSDAAPPLNQGIAPTWTEGHTWDATAPSGPSIMINMGGSTNTQNTNRIYCSEFTTAGSGLDCKIMFNAAGANWLGFGTGIQSFVFGRLSSLTSTSYVDTSLTIDCANGVVSLGRNTTVSALPAAGTAGRRGFVTDANATTFASIVAGSGTNGVPVYDDGTNWRIG